MPVGQPPLGGPLGRSRNRLSASALTTFLRCHRQWFFSNQVGLHGPLRPSQVSGIVLEDALCHLFMLHPPVVDDDTALFEWAESHLPELAEKAHARGRGDWESSLWNQEDKSWDDVELSMYVERLGHGLRLFIEEVRRCHAEGGGPYLDHYRSGQSPFDVPSPAWGKVPYHPRPEKVKDGSLRSFEPTQKARWSECGTPVTWHEAWECARPWVKDPRVVQPQRLYHPAGWASGELDLVFRWDGNIRLIDIKSGSPDSAFASSLEHQLRFYAWLWHETHQGQCVAEMEGWYLDGGHRVSYPAPLKEEMETLTNTYAIHHRNMQHMAEGVVAFPSNVEGACDGQSAGCFWCSTSRDENGLWRHPEGLEWITALPPPEIKAPYAPLSSIQGRVTVKGQLTGAWGPLPNHFSEPVLGAVLVAGQQHITLEESEPGAFEHLHSIDHQDVVIHNALPGVWRDQPRLYLDSNTEISPASETPNPLNVTRLGLLRTRANVKGHVMSIRQRSGNRLDGKPWSMVAFILWDGTHVAEVVAFGNSINQRILQLQPGDEVSMTGAELGWRAGLLQLRIDSRKTRVETSARIS